MIPMKRLDDMQIKYIQNKFEDNNGFIRIGLSSKTLYNL